ncbi:MAG: DsrE family protein [Firmicutes bacterium]|nr:DsrE family protein [Bacillota bacterium]
MGSLFLVLKAAPEQEQHAHFVVNLAQAAQAKGHKVTVHVFGDGIYYLVPNMHIGPTNTAELCEKENSSLMYCFHNVEQRGIVPLVMESARKASTPDASMEFIKHDRVLMISG